jgi:hypothetical protein
VSRYDGSRRENFSVKPWEEERETEKRNDPMDMELARPQRGSRAGAKPARRDMHLVAQLVGSVLPSVDPSFRESIWRREMQGFTGEFKQELSSLEVRNEFMRKQ